jgi:hypothetical protein
VAIFTRTAAAWAPLGLILAIALGVGDHPGQRVGALDRAADEVSGTILDRERAPLRGARVQLRDADRILISTTTGADGTFRLRLPASVSAPSAQARLNILVERLGFEDLLVERVMSLEQPLELVLLPAPLPVPGFNIDGEMLSCEDVDEESDARSIWSVAKDRHPGGLDTLGVASYTFVRIDTLTGGDLYHEPDEAAGVEPGQRGSSPIRRLGWARTIDRQGYAFPVRRATREGSFSSWSYAPLDADLSAHFGEEGFGRRHLFRISAEESDGWTLRFCARDRRRPHIDGWIEIDSDTLIRRVEWRFNTDEPVEHAGGWAVFPPASEGYAPFLLPLESMTWLTLDQKRTVRRAQWFEEWQLTEGDSVPFLPRRDPAAESPRP